MTEFKCGTEYKAAFSQHDKKRRLPKKILWHRDPKFQLPGLTISTTRAAIEAAFQIARHFCRIEFERTSYANKALIRLMLGPAEKFDGPSGTLAMADVRSLYDSEPREIWYDPGESWRTVSADDTSIYVLPVTCHEIGHTLGFGHGEKGLMAPFYDAEVMTPTEAARRRFFKEYPELQK